MLDIVCFPKSYRDFIRANVCCWYHPDIEGMSNDTAVTNCESLSCSFVYKCTVLAIYHSAGSVPPSFTNPVVFQVYVPQPTDRFSMCVFTADGVEKSAGFMASKSLF